MLGYTEAEVMRFAPPYPYWPEEERENIEQAFALHLEDKTPKGGFQLRFRKKSGAPIDVLVTASSISGPDGRPIGVLSALTDISPLQETRRELLMANERLQIAQDVMGLGIWDWDPAHDTLFWDRNSFALFGHPDATDPKYVWTAVHGEAERERLTYELERLIAAGATNGEDRLLIRWPDGTEHDILSTYVILRDESGKANRVIGVNRDITAELEEERELRHAQERLTAALEGGQYGTFEHIIGHGDVNWNATNYEINGVDPSVTDPSELFNLWKQGAVEVFPDLLDRMSKLSVDQRHLTYEFTARPPGKEPRRVRSSVFIERNKHGHPTRHVGITQRIG
jgi:PAS domain S-box-containing protein